MDSRSTYHRVLSGPALYDLMVVTFIHHLCMEFPVEYRIAIVRDDQRRVGECYLNLIRKAEPKDINVVIMNVTRF